MSWYQAAPLADDHLRCRSDRRISLSSCPSCPVRPSPAPHEPRPGRFLPRGRLLARRERGGKCERQRIGVVWTRNPALGHLLLTLQDQSILAVEMMPWPAQVISEPLVIRREGSVGQPLFALSPHVRPHIPAMHGVRADLIPE